MSGVGIKSFFDFADRVEMESLNHRLKRSQVISANVANAETPGFRALGYDFEEQLQTLSDPENLQALKGTQPKHYLHSFLQADSTIKPDVFVVPTETVPEDGNTVDIEREMSEFAKNQLLYRSAVETLNRKIGILKYAINGGR